MREKNRIMGNFGSGSGREKGKGLFCETSRAYDFSRCKRRGNVKAQEKKQQQGGEKKREISRGLIRSNAKIEKRAHRSLENNNGACHSGKREDTKENIPRP